MHDKYTVYIIPISTCMCHMQLYVHVYGVSPRGMMAMCISYIGLLLDNMPTHMFTNQHASF